MDPGRWWLTPTGTTFTWSGTLSNTVSGFKISPVSGSLAPLNPATVATGTGPKSIAIRGDDNWLFVTNYEVSIGVAVFRYACDRRSVSAAHDSDGQLSLGRGSEVARRRASGIRGQVQTLTFCTQQSSGTSSLTPDA